MAVVDVKQLLDAGVHYGHRASRWNPKMRPYIYGKRNLIHIIDLRETVRGLLRSYRYLSQVVSRGRPPTTVEWTFPAMPDNEPPAINSTSE